MIKPALSIRQPWAGLISLGFKDVENRTWKTPAQYIGQDFLVHAGKQPDWDVIDKGEQNAIYEAALDLAVYAGVDFKKFEEEAAKYPHVFKLGGVIGCAKVIICVNDSRSRWANRDQGTWHWLLGNGRPLTPHPYKGQLGFFQIDYPHSLAVPNA